MRFFANIVLLFTTFLLFADNAFGKFTDVCTDPFLMWEGAFFLVAKCPGKEEKVSVFWLRDCVTNIDGKMIPWKNGGASGSCKNCYKTDAGGFEVDCECPDGHGTMHRSRLQLDDFINVVWGPMLVC